MSAKEATAKPVSGALLVIAEICLCLVATSMPLFGQNLLVFHGTLPTPALPAGALPAASSAGAQVPSVQTPAAPGGSPQIVATPPIPSPPTTTGIIGASPRRGTPGAPQQVQKAASPGVSPPGGTSIAPDEVGYASWYGSRFHGRLTASGQIYNMDEMTAAHRTLPFGTKVLVTDLENGKSVVVTINDRGPFVSGRIIDLSRAAAEAIGLTGQGVARVRLHVITLGNGQRVPAMGPARTAGTASADLPAAAARPAGATGSRPTASVVSGAATPSPSVSAAGSLPTPTTVASSPPVASSGKQPAAASVVVQVGAFRDLANAVRLKDFLAQNGFDPTYEKWENYTRVVLLPVPESELAVLRQRLENIGITSILVRHN